MDLIGGINVVYYNKTQIRNELINNPKLLLHKKFMELFTGYLVTCALEKEYKTTFNVGFPLKAVKKQDKPICGHTIAELMENTNLIADTDVDIYLCNEALIIGCQITRIPKKINGISKFNDLIKTLEKKFCVQPDKKLCLIINVEDRLDIPVDELNDFLNTRSVPYGYIFMVGRDSNRYCKFKCCPIFPTLRESVEYDIGIPL